MPKDKYSKPEVTGSQGTMTVREVAEFFKLTTITVYKLAKTRKLASFRIGGAVRFNRAYIETIGQTDAEYLPA